jgi:hypothetical protein
MDSDRDSDDDSDRLIINRGLAGWLLVTGWLSISMAVTGWELIFQGKRKGKGKGVVASF